MRRCSHGAVSPCNHADNIAKRLDTSTRLQNARLQGAAGRLFTIKPSYRISSLTP
jgi:hypothetical protein